MSRAWENEKELADLIMERAKENKHVRLSPNTAQFLALKLYTASEKPTRDDIVKAICDSRCDKPCYPCLGKANVIVRAYGHSIKSDRHCPDDRP